MSLGLIPLSSYQGNWSEYEEVIFQIFVEEIVNGNLEYEGGRVICRRLPVSRNKWATFWHLIQEGRVEDDREPDLRRCERIRWIPYIISNAGIDPSIEVWENKNRGNSNTLLWYQEEYLVVLSRRSASWMLTTAYCTTQSGRIRGLRNERDAYLALRARAQKS